jgi:hypothetical protein
MKVKTFIFAISINEKDEDVINEFIMQNNANVISLTFNVVPMHDLHYDGNICNQWVEYIGVLIYNQN